MIVSRPDDGKWNVSDKILLIQIRSPFLVGRVARGTERDSLLAEFNNSTNKLLPVRKASHNQKDSRDAGVEFTIRSFVLMFLNEAIGQ